MKKLYRSQKNKILAGVCSGLGEYFEIDPVIIRLLWIVLTFLGGFGVVLYILAIFIIPLEPNEEYTKVEDEYTEHQESYQTRHKLEDQDKRIAVGLLALLFIAVGIIILISIVAPSTFFLRNFVKIVLSILLIGIGAYMLSTSHSKK